MLLVPPGSLLAAVVSLLPNVVVRGVFAFCLMELVCLVTEELLVETPRDAVPLGEAHVLRTFVPCSWCAHRRGDRVRTVSDLSRSAGDPSVPR